MKTKKEIIEITDEVEEYTLTDNVEISSYSSETITAVIDREPEKKVKTKKSRVWELDFLRGLSILLVCWDHLMYDSCSLFYKHFMSSGVDALVDWAEFSKSYWTGELRAFFRPIFLFIFFFVSGICVSFSRNNLFRSFKLVVAALIINLGTYLLTLIGMNCFILFGVVHSFAVIVLIYALLELCVKLVLRLTKKDNLFRYVMSGTALVFAIVGIVLDAVYNVSITEYDQGFVSTVGGEFFGVFFYKKGTYWNTADYFPIFPFFNYFFIGATLSTWLYPKKKSLLPCLDHKWHYPLTIPGRFSLYIYVLGQGVAIALLIIVSLIATGEIGLF